MPTGLTRRIEDGDPNYTFEHFVWTCARMFGPLLYMRDEAFDTPIYPRPESFRPKKDSDRYREYLTNYRERLAEV